MKRLLFLLCTISVCIYSSCTTAEEEVRKRRMQQADSQAYFKTAQRLARSGWDPVIIHSAASTAASVASQEAATVATTGGDYVVYPPNQINPNVRVPKNLELEFNPYEADGEMHNDAIDLIVKEKIKGVNVLDKLVNRDRETIDKFLKLNPQLQDDNIRKEAVDAIVAAEVPEDLKETLIKITNANDYEEGISYLDLSADAKTLVTEVHAKCNDYYVNEADFAQVADFLNNKITSLLNKGKDITIEDQQVAAMFTILKHSYYYWHGTKSR